MAGHLQSQRKTHLIQFTVRPATQLDAVYLAPRLRRADVQEIQAVSGLAPLRALSIGIQKSLTCRVGCANNVPFVIFGVADSLIPGEAAIWMVGTEDIRKYGKTVCRIARQQIQEFHKLFPILRNYADERNKVHLEWLRFLGARFLKKTPYGVEGRTFREFEFKCATPQAAGSSPQLQPA